MAKARRAASTPGCISDRLREIIAKRGLTAYAIARDVGLKPTVISRFLNRERSLTLGTLDVIAANLGLRLTENGKGRPGRPARASARSAEETAD